MVYALKSKKEEKITGVFLHVGTRHHLSNMRRVDCVEFEPGTNTVLRHDRLLSYARCLRTNATSGYL